MIILNFTTEKVFTNITRDVQDKIPDGFNGVVHVFSQHTTASIRILENEILLHSDYLKFLEDTFPEKGHFRHDYVGIRDVPPDERINGYSHLRSLLFNTSEMIPVLNGKMLLGQWETLFLVEMDGVRSRSVVVSFLDEASEKH